MLECSKRIEDMHSQPKATTSRTQKSHPRGLVGPSRISSRQGTTQGCQRDRPSLAMTTQNGGEATPLARSLGTTIAPPQANARGLDAPRAPVTRSSTASNTSVSDVISSSSRSTQTQPHTHVGSPLASENHDQLMEQTTKQCA